MEYAGKNGYRTHLENENGEQKITSGKYHPIIWSMCYKISEFNAMAKKYGEDNVF